MNKAEFKDFDGQWVEIFSAGNRTDSEGRAHAIDRTRLATAVTNFAAKEHEPPIVIGHPKENAPAYGWTRGVRMNGDKLEARFADVDPTFEGMVRKGAFKKRSASFYLGKDGSLTLQHVGFLGAAAPAVKGLRDVQFSSDTESVAFESNLNFSEEESMKDEDVNGIVDRVVDKIKGLFGGGDAEKGRRGDAASFNEADLTKKITAAVTASFSEEIKTRDTKIEELSKKVDQQSSKVTRAEIASFVESIGKDKLPPALRSGLVEFMETLDGSAAGSPKVIVIEFTEEAGVKKETRSESSQLAYFKEWLGKLPAMISFGPQFDGIQGSGSEGIDVDPVREKKMRESIGIKPKEDAK